MVYHRQKRRRPANSYHSSNYFSQKNLANQIVERGAMPCVAMVTLDEYIDELSGFEIKQFCLLE